MAVALKVHPNNKEHFPNFYWGQGPFNFRGKGLVGFKFEGFRTLVGFCRLLQNFRRGYTWRFVGFSDGVRVSGFDERIRT